MSNNETLEEKVKAHLKPWLERVIRMDCDVLTLNRLTPIPIEDWSEDVQLLVLAWCVADHPKPMPKALAKAMEPLEALGLLQPDWRP